MATAKSQVVQAIRTDPDTGEAKPIGDLSVDAEGMLAVVAARPGSEDFLAELVKDMNKKSHVNVKAPPPPELDTDDAGRFAKRVPRTDPGFFEAVQTYLRYYYNVALEKKG